jgi:hypothetical protein
MCLAEIATPTSRNDSLHGLPSFSLNFFPLCSACVHGLCNVGRVRVCSVCLCMVCVHGVWRVCSVCMCMACVHVCSVCMCMACVHLCSVWLCMGVCMACVPVLCACVLVCLCGVREFFPFQFQLVMISMNTHL